MPERKRRAKRNAPKGENLTRRHSELVARRGMIVALREEGLTHAQIADRVGVAERTVWKWLTRFIHLIKQRYAGIFLDDDC